MVLLAVGLVAAVVGCSPEEATHYGRVNDLRRTNGLEPLLWDDAVYPKAHAWSQQMAQAQRISHSRLDDGVPVGSERLGENVAVNTSLEGAFEALQNSPKHRKNYLNPHFTHLAVGVVFEHGSYWVTEIFVG